ncbi:MAG: hypothetical protein M3Z66_24980 [Chloroflexota bacterium]|nr:hypothetical protein [Chloroflexota bacterium]
MDRRDAKQAIADHLTAPRTRLADEPVTGGWHSSVWQGGCDARPESIRFLKTRSIPGRQLHAVVFEMKQGPLGQRTCALSQDQDGTWRVEGGAGGGTDLPDRDPPVANLGGGGWPTRFYAGGRVLDTSGQVGRVRLISSNGTTLEDTVDERWVLFLTDQPMEPPIQVQLYDGTGSMLNQHPLF